MAHKDLQSLFFSSPFSLPYLEENDGNSFLHHFSDKIENYYKEVEALPENVLGNYDKTLLLERLEKIITGLKTTLELYLEGYPSSAYSCFMDMIDDTRIMTELDFRRTIELDSNYPLYRVKKEYNKDNVIFHSASNGFGGFLNSIDLFHVPFERRRTIGTNRFSIPGFPCMYASESLHASWSESTLKDHEPFHAICLTNHRPLYIVDVSPIHCIDYTNNPYYQKNPEQILIDYIFLYPLILACHSKINYKPLYEGEEIKFKSEYIVPQLLLQWYREKKRIVDGIRYLSCTATLSFPSVKCNKFNYVIPVYECYETGYCKSLIYNFSATPVYSYIKTSSMDVPEILNLIQESLSKQPLKPLSDSII